MGGGLGVVVGFGAAGWPDAPTDVFAFLLSFFWFHFLQYLFLSYCNYRNCNGKRKPLTHPIVDDWVDSTIGLKKIN